MTYLTLNQVDEVAQILENKQANDQNIYLFAVENIDFCDKLLESRLIVY